MMARFSYPLHQGIHPVLLEKSELLCIPCRFGRRLASNVVANEFKSNQILCHELLVKLLDTGVEFHLVCDVIGSTDAIQRRRDKSMNSFYLFCLLFDIL